MKCEDSSKNLFFDKKFKTCKTNTEKKKYLQVTFILGHILRPYSLHGARLIVNFVFPWHFKLTKERSNDTEVIANFVHGVIQFWRNSQ